MLEVQREAILADVTAQSQHLQARELDAILNFVNSLAAQAAFLGGWFSMWSYETTINKGSSIDNGGSNAQYKDAVVVLYYVFSCVSICAFVITCVAAALISSSATVFGLTSGSPQAVGQAVLKVREDRSMVMAAFGVGVVSFLLALILQYGTDAIRLSERILNTIILCLTLIGIVIISWRTLSRHRYVGLTQANVSGDEFLKMDSLHRATASAGGNHVAQDAR